MRRLQPPWQKKGGDSREWPSPPIINPLMSEAQVSDQLPIALQVCLPQVLQKSPPFPHHLEEAAAAVMVLLVGIEVIPEVVDSSRQEGDLDRSASPVSVMQLVFLDDFLAIDGHSCRASARV
jgi:hypothetical protein